MTVAVVSCVYGGYRDFVPRWWEAIQTLNPPPDQVIVASDRLHAQPFSQVVKPCTWAYPQAFYLNAAVTAADTDWVWVCDIDDYAMPDALQGIDDVDADVWQMGFKRSDGEVYIPPQLTAAQYLGMETNVFVAGSAFRVDAYRRAGGYRDVAIQDWGLWCVLAAHGATFESSGRAHFHYMRHPRTRTETETTIEQRPKHVAEIERSLVV